MTSLPCMLDTFAPQPRLPDARLALDQEPARASLDLVQEPVDGAELVHSADQRVRHDPSGSHVTTALAAIQGPSRSGGLAADRRRPDLDRFRAAVSSGGARSRARSRPRRGPDGRSPSRLCRRRPPRGAREPGVTARSGSTKSGRGRLARARRRRGAPARPVSRPARGRTARVLARGSEPPRNWHWRGRRDTRASPRSRRSSVPRRRRARASRARREKREPCPSRRAWARAFGLHQAVRAPAPIRVEAPRRRSPPLRVARDLRSQAERPASPRRAGRRGPRHGRARTRPRRRARARSSRAPTSLRR